MVADDPQLELGHEFEEVAAHEASRLKDDFLASLSHELRTPLNAILGYARMLRTGMLAADKHGRAIETIERNATSLTQIVEDVLDISRIVSGKIRLNVQPVGSNLHSDRLCARLLTRFWVLHIMGSLNPGLGL